MKLKYALLALFAGAALAVGCATEEPVSNDLGAIKLSPSILVFDGKTAGSATVEVAASESWSASGIPEWMTISPSSGGAGTAQVTVSVEVGGEKARSAEVAFKAGADTRLLTVNQEGGVKYGTKDNPYSASQAYDWVAEQIADAKTSEVYIKGIICRIIAPYVADEYGNANFMISDDGKDEGKVFQCYRCLYLNGAKYSNEADPNISVGDEVLVYGKCVNYKGNTPETSQNEAYLVELKAGTSPVLVGEVTSVELLADETEGTFSITAKNLKGKWTVTPKATYNWVSDYTKEGTESGNIVVKVAANTSEEARTAEFTVAAEGVPEVALTLTQKGAKIVTDVAGIAAQITSTDSKNPSAYAANLTGAVVSYVNGSNAYIEDASGAILLYLKDHGLTPGKKISGPVKGTGYKYNGLPEITGLGSDVKIEDGGTIPETTMTIADLVKNYGANLSRRIKLAGVTVKDAIADGDRNGVVTQNDAEIKVYAALNNKGLVLTEGAKGDLICYPTIYAKDGQETQQVSFWDNADFASSTPSITTEVNRVEIDADAKEAKFTIAVKNLTGKWTVTPKETYDWVTEYTKEGTAGGDIVVKVAANTGEARTAEFTVASEGAAPLVLTLVQKAASLATDIAGVAAQITSTSSSNPSSYTANLTGAVVSYVNGSNAYIEDASGAILLYLKDHGLSAGMKISGLVEGKGYLYNGLPEIVSVGNAVTVEPGGTIPETTMTVADLVANYQANLSRRIKLVGVTVTDGIADGDRNGVITQNGADINVYAALKDKGLLMLEGNKGDLICYPTLYVKDGNSTKQVSFWQNNDWTVTSIPDPGNEGIKTADELLEWLLNPREDAKLGADIDLSGKVFNPLNDMTVTFDGNGKTITVQDADHPIFMNSHGTIKNVTFAGSFKGVPGQEKFQLAPIGRSYGTLENVVNKASVTVTGPALAQEGGATVAGIACEAYGPVKNCKNEGKISVDAAGKDTWTIAVAGVVGYLGAAIEGCENKGEVSLVAGSPLGRTGGMTEVTMKYNPVSSVAGVVTYAVSDPEHTVTVKDCNNSGKVSFTYDNLNESSAAVSRSPVAGIVANSGGDITNCHNTGDIYAKMVAADRSAAYSKVNIILHAAGVQGADYFVKKIKAAADQNETSVIGCSNSGNIYVDSDMTASNSAVGGVSAWPAAEAATITTIKDCNNSGNISVKGLLKIRVGGIAGGTNSIENCKNTGNILVENADAGSVIGLINGFHTQVHKLSGCEATGKIESKVAITGVGGLCGGIGNVANTLGENCKVNATVIGGGTVQTGLIVGNLNGDTKKVTIGTAEQPVKVAGSVNGVEATADNYMSLIHNASKFKEDIHIFNVVFGK